MHPWIERSYWCIWSKCRPQTQWSSWCYSTGAAGTPGATGAVGPAIPVEPTGPGGSFGPAGANGGRTTSMYKILPQMPTLHGLIFAPKMSDVLLFNVFFGITLILM